MLDLTLPMRKLEHALLGDDDANRSCPRSTASHTRDATSARPSRSSGAAHRPAIVVREPVQADAGGGGGFNAK